MEKESETLPEQNKKQDTAKKPSRKARVPAVRKETLPAVKKTTIRKEKEKVFTAKKLPGLFKKKYTESQFSKKIAKRLFIAKDLEYVKSLFKPEPSGKKTFLIIPSDVTFTKKELLRIKMLTKQIKKQKSRIKWIPLAAFVGVIVALVTVVTLFKDSMIKQGIRIGLESAFQAKCDIGYVHLGILDSSFSVRKLAVADKENPMTNLFEIDTVTLDFDLVQLLKKRFAADVLELAGVQIGTPRKTDGTLPVKEKKQKKEQPPKPKTEVQLQLEAFAAQKTDVAKNSIAGIFEQYNPETLLASYYAQLKSPAIAQTVYTEMEEIIPVWIETPQELYDSVTKVIADSQSVIEFDWKSIQSDPKLIKSAIEQIKSAVDSVTALQKKTDNTVKMLKRDSDKVKNYSTQLQKAVQADYSFVNKEINKITSFTVKDGQNFLTESFNSVFADMVGTYYPVIQQGIAYVKEYSGYLKDDSVKKVKEKKSAVARYVGRNIDFRKDTTPSFLIKKIHGSGSDERFSLDIVLSDVCNDMDKWGKPVSIKASAVHGRMKDSLTGTFDIREKKTGSMLNLVYSGSGYPITVAVPGADDVPGVPTVKGTGAFSAKLLCDENGNFSLNGDVLLDSVSITAAAFEPEFASRLYAKALAKFSSVKAGLAASYSDTSGLKMGVSSDIDRQCAAVLKTLMNEELTALKDSAAIQVKQSLESAISGVTEQFSYFNDLKTKIESEAKKLDDFKAELERKSKEGEAKLRNAAEAAAKEAAAAAAKAAEDAVKSAASSAADAAKDSLKNLFNKQR